MPKQKNQDPTRLQILQIGSSSVGKTCLLYAWETGKFKKEYEPTVLDNFCTTARIGKELCSVTIYDTSGNEAHAEWRRMSYANNIHAVMIMFGINDFKSYCEVFSKWIPEVQELLPTIPYFVIGTKSDLRTDDDDDSLVKFVRAKEESAKEGSIEYRECSAGTYTGVEEVYQGILNMAFYSRLNNNKKLEVTSNNKASNKFLKIFRKIQERFRCC